MGSRKWEHQNADFDERNGCCNGRHGGVNSLMGLIFGIVSFSIKLAFKIVEVVFQALFGLLSGIGSATRNSQKSKSLNEKPAHEKDVKYTINDIKQEAYTGKTTEKKDSGTADNVREFKKPGSNKAQSEAAAAESSNKAEEVHNKDFYIFLFILTIIPVIVALAMGKLLYAGIIGGAGFGFMLLTGLVTGIVRSTKKRASEQRVEEEKEETKDDDSVEKLIKDAFEKLFVIKKDIDRIPDAEIRGKLEAICCTGEKIIGEVRTNPESLTHVRKFFYYYLDAFGEIVKKYLKLSNFEESSEEVGKLVAETEKAFADIDGIFKDLCEKLLEKDMMHLKAEINVIKNSN